jgi:3-oxoacyl-[acyl-carrier-protein] synthase-3
MARYTVFRGTGSCIPDVVWKNADFRDAVFYGPDGKVLDKPTAQIIADFKDKTKVGIEERRYARPDQTASDLGFIAAERTLESSGFSRETVGCISVAHNFENTLSLGSKLDLVPSFAARIKRELGIDVPAMVAYDIVANGEDLRRINDGYGLTSGEKSLVVELDQTPTDGNLSGVYELAREKLADLGIDKDGLERIVVVHKGIPNMAGELKKRLGLRSDTVAYSIIFGCPGWLQAVIQADQYFKLGKAKRALVLGAETLSRVSDPRDMDRMIYSDGSGGWGLEDIESEHPVGILSHAVRSDALEYAYLLRMGKSYDPSFKCDGLFLKMEGPKLFKYAAKTVPHVIKECLDRAGMTIDDVNMGLFHQANQRLDEAMLHGTYRLYGKTPEQIPENVMPLTIPWLGNNSVVTLPMASDLIARRGDARLKDYSFREGDVLLLASVGAGMNSNAVAYVVP